MPKEKERKKLEKCLKCGTPLIPDLDAINFTTKKWDGHTWKWNCKCFSKDIRLSIG